jgi:hypothetical protein
MIACWQPVVLAVICFVLLLVVAQSPFTYAFTVGTERGYESDLPFLQGFKASESQGRPQRWRWSHSQYVVEVPGVGQRGVVVQFSVIAHRGQWEIAADGAGAYVPPTLTVRAGSADAVVFPLRLQRATYRLYVPPHALSDGVLRLQMATEPWQNPDDRREDMGVALSGPVRVVGVPSEGAVVPDRALLLAYPLGLVLLWVALQVVGFSRNGALVLLLPLAVGLPLATLAQAPRVGFGAGWALQMGALSVAAAVVCVLVVPPLLRRVAAVPPGGLLRWLLLLLVLSFVLKFGGRLYPESMPGDLQLHVNRSIQTLQGQVYIEAQHRGLPFPFPNGPYIMIVPLMVAGLDLRLLLQVTLGIYEAATVALLYVIVARGVGSARWGVVAAAIYALTAGGFMNTWFMFHTQVAAQAASVVLLAVLVVAWPRYHRPPAWWGLVVLFVLVFLGHIGLFINTSLVGVLIVPLLWWRMREFAAQRGVRWLLGAGVAAAAFAFAFYYSAFFGLIVEQTTGVMTKGLNEVTERPPIPRETTLWVTWEGGFITHFGFFPVLLAVPGALVLSDGRLRGSLLPPLLWLTFAVSASQAVLPLITLNSITTRWLMFASWAIAVAGAVGVLLVWKRGGAGRVVALVMGGYVCWMTGVVYYEALALRLPPIEPF